MERKVSLLEAGKGQKGCSGHRGPSLCCSPLLFQGAGAEEQSRDTQGGQREGPTAHLDLHHAVNQLRKEKFSAAGGRAGGGPCSELALLRSAFMQKGKLAVLKDARSH